MSTKAPDWHHMTYTEAIKDPGAFASKIYSDMGADGFPLLIDLEPKSQAKYNAARTELEAAVSDIPELKKLFDKYDDAAFDMAMEAQSRGMKIGIAFEGFRRSLAMLEVRDNG